MAERIAARSTTAGTPVKSCIRIRAGMKATSAVEGSGQRARAMTSSAETPALPSRRNTFSASTLIVWGKRARSTPASAARPSRRNSSTVPFGVSSRARW